MKSKRCFSIEQEVINRLEEYIKKRKGIFGGKISRSSIVETALAKELVNLDAELERQRPNKKSLSVAR